MWTDWTFRWVAVATLSLIDGVWLSARSVGFEYHALLQPVRLAASLFVVCVITTIAIARLGYLRFFFAGTTDFFYSVIQFTLLVPAVLTLSYLAATLDAPLVDGALLRADGMVGFDWHALDIWVAAHHSIEAILSDAYFTLFMQPTIALLVISMHRPGRTNGEFIWTFLLSALLCFALFAAFPAIGYEGEIGPKHIAALKQCRDGLWTTLDFTKANGIVTFPSFHAIFAVIITYAVRQVRWALAVFAPLNALMLISTPTVGGHYLADVVAGIGVAVISIALTRVIQRWTARLTHRHAIAIIRTRMAERGDWCASAILRHSPL